jgi:EAL domain-containing protein (putative c-di-GMP-specific phosphodiesterase class I)
VRELMTRRDARAIARTIVALANTLNMKTIAEGIEDPAQAAVLRRYGCSAMQGFVVAQPLAAPDVALFLVGWNTRARPASFDDTPTALLPLGEAA